jgi:hypothetical protein|tara:strand:+ start:1649 stop:2242 length:594 start_codon:yes stop_codon:yes gene_type:complete
MSKQKKPVARRNRWLLLGFLATFIVPIIVGQLAYDGSWFRGGQTNKGELINPPLATSNYGWQTKNADAPALDARWWVVYALPESCNAACQQSIQALPRMHESIGRERERMGILLVAAEGQKVLPEWLPESLSNADFVQWVTPTVSGSALTQDSWYIMDPMGWMMLRYAIPSEEAPAILRAQELLDDLLKLLKASRIG